MNKHGRSKHMRKSGGNWPIIILIIIILIIIILIAITVIAPRFIEGSTQQFKTFMDNM